MTVKEFLACTSEEGIPHTEYFEEVIHAEDAITLFKARDSSFNKTVKSRLADDDKFNCKGEYDIKIPNAVNPVKLSYSIQEPSGAWTWLDISLFPV